jgi:hypothetical protein
MAFLAPLLGAVAGPLLGKIFGQGEDGIRNVPKTGLYKLHKGEVVVKKKDAMKIPKAIKMKQASKPQPIPKKEMKKLMAKSKK